jgi:hypothetical protein
MKETYQYPTYPFDDNTLEKMVKNGEITDDDVLRVTSISRLILTPNQQGKFDSASYHLVLNYKPLKPDGTTN